MQRFLRTLFMRSKKLKNLLMIDKLTKYGTCKLCSHSVSKAVKQLGVAAHVFNPIIKGGRGQ